MGGGEKIATPDNGGPDNQGSTVHACTCTFTQGEFNEEIARQTCRNGQMIH